MSNADTTTGQSAVRGYLVAFQDRDVVKCTDIFTNQATIHFLSQVFSGRTAIETWHRERFSAELKLLEIGQFQETGEGLCVDVVAASRVLESLGMFRVSVRVNLVLHAGKLHEMRFQPLMKDTINQLWNPR